MTRRTKIVATLGPACEDPNTVAAMVAAGTDCFRINCSHGTTREQLAAGRRVRAAARAAGRPLALMVDLQGPKVRLSAVTATRRVARGELVTLVGSDAAPCADAVRVELPQFVAAAWRGSEIAIGDGAPRFVVEEVRDDALLARATVAGEIGPSKGIVLAGARLDLPSLTEKDLRDLDVVTRLRADYVALSFVGSAADVERLRTELARRGSGARIVAKIERLEAYRRLDEILAVADGVMVARGDYGIDAGLSSVPLMQKDVISRARAAGKLVVTATQMLESMVHAAQPTRAEVSDVVNAVLDGTSAVMLSGETGVGAFPVAAVETMAELVTSADAVTARPVVDELARAAPVMHAAVELARVAEAQAIVVPTETGKSARACSRQRPSQRIVAPCLGAEVAAQLALEWGVEPFTVRRAGWSDRVLEDALARAGSERGLRPGAPIVVAAGVRSRTPNMIALRSLPPADG